MVKTVGMNSLCGVAVENGLSFSLWFSLLISEGVSFRFEARPAEGGTESLCLSPVGPVSGISKKPLESALRSAIYSPTVPGVAPLGKRVIRVLAGFDLLVGCAVRSFGFRGISR
jgi:hypothetical protein